VETLKSRVGHCAGRPVDYVCVANCAVLKSSDKMSESTDNLPTKYRNLPIWGILYGPERSEQAIMTSNKKSQQPGETPLSLTKEPAATESVRRASCRMLPMNIDKEQFLNFKTLPARLNAAQAAWYLGFSPHEIPILVTQGLLKPLGRPARNAPKFFASATLEEFRRDVKWLGKACDSISEHWKHRNHRQPRSEPPIAETPA
jgi:hypothetical protein